MPVAPMQKIMVVGHRQIRRQVLATLQKNALLEITAPSDLTLPANQSVEEENWELELAELEFALRLLDHFSGRKKSFIESFAPPKEAVKEAVLKKTVQEFDWRSLVKKIEGLEAQLTNLKNLEHLLRTELEVLLPWQSLGVPLNQLVSSDKICITAVSGKAKKIEGLNTQFKKLDPSPEIQIIQSTKAVPAGRQEKVYLLIFCLTGQTKELNDILTKAGFEKVTLPLSPRTPAEEIKNLKQLLLESAENQKNTLKQIQALAQYRTPLTYVYDCLFQENLKKIAAGKLARTEKTFVLTGWIPQKKLERLKNNLRQVTLLVEVQPILPDKNEIPPTLIENITIFSPFEVITRIFGSPGQHEIDPTAPLSFFYLLFFAMCLSDVGYGIILSLVSFYYLKKLTLSEGGRNILILLFWGGIATIIVGVLTGSYFGIDLNQLSPPLGNFLKRMQIIDPIKNPLNVLILSLILGVTQNLFGIGLAMYWKLKNKELVSAVLDYGLWIFFLLSLVLFVSGTALGAFWSGIFANFSIAGAIALVLTQGRNEKTFLKKAVSGILSLYKTTGYLGDTLSYSRLLALMMTTSIIGMVINILAGITAGSIPILGYVFMFLILLVGHTFNLVVSTLGAFIHSARLQLVEFFGKFYEGSGREFKPFRHETKYVIIK